ncbi:MAG: sigma-70 family RNA polymerase sigma factor, partial [Flavobacteriales bacterium]
RVKEQETAEDLVQQTFIAAWEGRDRFAGNSSPRTWLFRILKNKLADHYRKVYREPEVSSCGDDVERFDTNGRWLPEHRPTDWDHDEAADKEALHRALGQCLETLPTNWRAAVEMKYLKERDAEAICQELGITPTNYWQQLHRAKVKLRGCIEQRLRNTTH